MIFTREQTLELREMVADWVAEGFTTPPYEPVQYDIFEKLGVTSRAYDIKRPREEA